VAEQDGTTRGQFLTLSTVGLGAMIGGVIGVPATAYLLAPVTQETTFQPVLLGSVDNFKQEQSFKPTAATYVEDAKQPFTSAGLAWVHYTGQSGTTWDGKDAMFIVFSNRCMHLGCPVDATLTGFACPCHGGQYNKEGQRIGGPPIRPLDRFQWQLKNSDSELWITERWSVDFNSSGQIQYYKVKGPGQPVTVPWGGSTVSNILYPPVTYNYPAGS
jgi:quinol---cytochrome c reductase iron-sulfur subunit, bacillus type